MELTHLARIGEDGGDGDLIADRHGHQFEKLWDEARVGEQRFRLGRLVLEQLLQRSQCKFNHLRITRCAHIYLNLNSNEKI